MTRVAIISDVHADVHALQDALRAIERLECDLVVCAGDLVDYGLFPEETIALLREQRVTCVRGNHDRWAVGRGRADDPNSAVDAEPRDASGWDLSLAALRFLAELPVGWNATIDGVRVAVRHGSPKSDMDGIYPDLTTDADLQRWIERADAEVLIVGHTHIAFRRPAPGGGVVANPGALLRDRAEPQARGWIYDPEQKTFVKGPEPGGGTFGVLELPSKRFTIHRVSGDPEPPAAEPQTP